MRNEMFFLMKQELLLTCIIFFILIAWFGSKGNNRSLLILVNILLLINCLGGWFMQTEGSLFGGFFHTDPLIVLEKNILNLGVFIISMQAYDWLMEHKHAAEFYVLLLSTLLGLFFMISAGNLLLFYLGLELSSIPLATLSNFDLGKRRSSEAAMKYILSAAFSSGLLLFGISLVYGTTGSLAFAEISTHLNGSPLQLLAFILLFSGFAFKISVVPFHLWTADVYEGSPVAVTAYLSVISKGAVFFVFVPVLYRVFNKLDADWSRMLLLLAILTMIVGNLFAIRQQNLKRLLAFSSIAQVGFILVGITGISQAGSASVVYFVLVYLFSNLGAFGVVSFISSRTGKEKVDDYKGLYATNPVLAWVMAISLFSLAGIPPTAGFFGKFFLLLAGAGGGNYGLIVIAALNMIVSLYYYLRVIRAMFMETSDHPIEKLKLPVMPAIAIACCMGGVILTGLFGWIYDHIYALSRYI